MWKLEPSDLVSDLVAGLEMVLEGREAEEEAEVVESSDGEAEGSGAPRRRAGLMLGRGFGDGEEGEGADLLMRGGGVLQWLQALDLQVMGACRADERLKPLLKFNFSAGVAEDRLLSHLNQVFFVVGLITLIIRFLFPLFGEFVVDLVGE